MIATLPRLLSIMSVAAAIGLAGCSAGTDAVPAPTVPTPPPGPAPTSISAPAPAELPAAADGGDVRACADGTCEVRITAGTEIPLPRQSRMTAKVVSIRDPLLVLAGESSGGTTRFDGSGCPDCRIQQMFATQTTPGMFEVTMRGGSTVRFNELSIVVVAIRSDAAVLRITSA